MASPLNASNYQMGPSHTELQNTLEHIVRLLVDDPDAVTITPETSSAGICYRIRVSEADLGKMIGKQGRTARAIRTLVSCHAQKVGLLVSVDIVAGRSLSAVSAGEDDTPKTAE